MAGQGKGAAQMTECLLNMHKTLGIMPTFAESGHGGAHL